MRKQALFIVLFLLSKGGSVDQIVGKADASQVYEKAIPSVVVVWCQSREGQTQGSGVILSEDGLVATNYHVCDGATAGRVKLRDGRIFDELTVVATDEIKDILILRINSKNLPFLLLADSDSVKVGANVYAIGSPRGLEGTITPGIVSAIRPANEIDSTASGFKFIQFTASISPGSSGGPLLNDSGLVIGLTTGSRRDAQSVNAAIPSNDVAPLIAVRGTGQSLTRFSPKDESRSVPAAAAEGDVLTNEAVISLVKSGLSSSVVIAKIKSSPSRFDTSTQGLLKLAESKVSDDIVLAILEVQKQTRIAEAETKKALAGFREQGSVAELKRLSRVYIISELQRIWISEAMRKAGFTVVDKIENAQFFINYYEQKEYRQWITGAPDEQKVGYLQVTAVPHAPDAEVPRSIFSTRKTKYWYTDEQPYKAAVKQLLSELAKVR